MITGMVNANREAIIRLLAVGLQGHQAWEAGKFDADPDRSEVMYVAMLLPLAQ